MAKVVLFVFFFGRYSEFLLLFIYISIWKLIDQVEERAYENSRAAVAAAATAEKIKR